MRGEILSRPIEPVPAWSDIRAAAVPDRACEAVSHRSTDNHCRIDEPQESDQPLKAVALCRLPTIPHSPLTHITTRRSGLHLTLNTTAKMGTEEPTKAALIAFRLLLHGTTAWNEPQADVVEPTDLSVTKIRNTDLPGPIADPPISIMPASVASDLSINHGQPFCDRTSGQVR